MTIFNKLKIMSEVVLLLPNTEHLQQVEYYVRGCITSTKYWTSSTSWILCQRLYYFYRIPAAVNRLEIILEVVLLLPYTGRSQHVEDYVRGCIISTKYWPQSTSWILCQRLYYFYQIPAAINKLEIILEVVLLLPNTVRSQKLKIMSEVVLLLPNTGRSQHVEYYVRGCITSTKYRLQSTSWRLY